MAAVAACEHAAAGNYVVVVEMEFHPSARDSDHLLVVVVVVAVVDDVSAVMLNDVDTIAGDYRLETID